jgi:hypothetical protein
MCLPLHCRRCCRRRARDAAAAELDVALVLLRIDRALEALPVLQVCDS